ncbi:class I SAM-dependent methyltransferase [Silvibacterium dinghuense]|uniref:SAM-dependent methyltransferase n=1 Tax=Silvibacterium dinghuense TaxID=1560006 RepID=A0A4Q1SA96_9BACT|nr:class I SAM-dependent methyltransferase [Silvibacterium dinghuense]RXS93851.1 SAM-dependent methyltransferase [Silvibacterium dinghuense]GGH08220.1 hypothetical protein GCM10011586_25650 [Silvibacterium dinghuense]
MPSHSEKTDDQFGRTANAYLSSTVHSQGPDLIAIAEKFTGAAKASVLDLGCGAGHVSFTIAPHAASVVACDLSARMLQVVREEAERRGLENITTRPGKAEQLPFADASFDWVCTRYSAHHWQDVSQAIGEVRRVLKPGGGFLVVDTCAPANPLLDTHMQTLELLRDGSHIRNYTLAEWRGMLEAQGFQIRAHQSWKIDLAFQSWVERMQTPALHVEALRSLLKNAPQEVRDYFHVAEDGSFQSDSLLIEARR